MATVMITGANRGIGLGLAQQYLARGDQVIAACRDPAAPSLGALDGGEQLRIVQVDVGDNQSITKMAAELSGQAIDVLINNAGVGGGEQQKLDNIEPDHWLRVLRINVMSPLFVTRALLPNLTLAKPSKVMVISSQLGAISYPPIGAYAYESSKAGVNKVVKGMAADLQEKGIAVFAIHPGWVQTDMGGPNATLTVEESASGLADTFAKLALDQTGSFWQWDGKEHAW